MYCVDLLFYLLQFAFVVHCMPQPQKPEESSFEKSGLDSVDWNEAYFDDILNGKAHNNYLLSATSPDKDDLSSSIYRKSTDAFPSTCLAPTESRDNNILKDRSIYKYPNKNGMCSVLRIHSSVEDEGSHRVFPVIPVDDKQGMTELRGKPDLNICSEAGFPDRPIPVCPSPLPGSVLIFDDGTMLLEFATTPPPCPAGILHLPWCCKDFTLVQAVATGVTFFVGEDCKPTDPNVPPPRRAY